MFHSRRLSFVCINKRVKSRCYLIRMKLTLQERIQNAWDSSLNVLVAVMQGVLVFLAAALPVLVLLPY